MSITAVRTQGKHKMSRCGCQLVSSVAVYRLRLHHRIHDDGEGWEAGSCRLAYTPSNDYLTPAGGCLPLRGMQTVTA